MVDFFITIILSFSCHHYISFIEVMRFFQGLYLLIFIFMLLCKSRSISEYDLFTDFSFNII